MQPHQLRYFVAIAETGSFTAGAQRARVVQSAASTAVRQLERELGCALFTRGRRIALTPEGEALLPRARDVLAALDAARAAVAATRGQVAGTVSLGMMNHLAGFDLASLLAAFGRAHPAVVVHARQTATGSRGSLDAVRSGDLDLALVSTAGETVPGMRLRYLDSEPIRFVCHRSHPLAGAGSVRLAQIADEAFIDSPVGWGNRAVVDGAFAAAGLRRAIQTEATDFELGQALVRERLGVMFVPASAVSPDPQLVALDVEPALTWTVRLAHSASRPLSAAAAALAAELERGGRGEPAAG
ncbi:LysR family transcriptional regulator [Promicromonospora sp. NPDC050262]|uniref:LysR family transcriptional regulator n=1 Tax=Promicromonospora sp. NPDC050262 TaxID=3155036 RepID=UPI0033C76793